VELAFGLRPDVGEKLTLRAGRPDRSDPDPRLGRDPRVPDADRVDYNVGASFRMSGKMSLDAAAGYTDLEDSPISRDERFYAGTPAQTDILTDGRAHGQRVLVFALGGRLSF
jgi:long-chain fatty acid transport protein